MAEPGERPAQRAPETTETGSSLAVSARGIEVRYARDGEPAVADVDLDVAFGEVVLLSGPPGSGKSSLLKALAGLTPAAGTITALGRPPGHPDALARLGYAPEGRPVDPRVAAREIARIVARLRGRPVAEGEAALTRLGLTAPERRCGRLDPEEMRRLTLALAEIGDPMLVLLDQPWEMPETADVLSRTRARGGAVVMALDEAGALGGLADRTLHLVDGRTR